MRHSGLMASLAMMGMLGAGALALNPLAVELLESEPPRKRKVATYSSAPRIRGRLPHIGAKERARHAGKPDGAMHGLPPLFRKGASA